MTARPDTPPPHAGHRPGLLALGALGVVFGDIGTNVLFALRAAFHGPHALPATRENVMGVLSLIAWALVLVIGIKYLTFVMRADNRGEGGILALLAMVAPRDRPASGRKALLVSVGLFGAALVYGDGIITPAISVLAAVEGLALEEPLLGPVVVPATTVILVVLFLVQHRGTGRLGRLFGPVMLAWFGAIAALGAAGIAREPHVLAAANPAYAARFIAQNGLAGFLALGAVVLTVAGAEALYADLGHFGIKPIRMAWFAVVFPALLLDYFGQGAVLLTDPGAVASPFYALVPLPLHYPMVALATLATIIASQALISGAFSLTSQAIQLGYLPRATIRHTSAVVPGQIYVPEVDAALLVACVGLVLSFRESSGLASAYGMAVAAAMATTTMLYFFVARERWHWSAAAAAGLAIAFFIPDLSFVLANIAKIPHGAWIPLVVAGAVYTVMTVWRQGTDLIAASLTPVPVPTFLRALRERPPTRVPGAAVFLSSREEAVPPELLHYVRRSRTLQQQLVLLVVSAADIPRVTGRHRQEERRLAGDILQVTVRYGFMESPDIPKALHDSAAAGALLRGDDVTYFIGQVTPVRTDRPGMAQWRKALFVLFWNTSRPARVHLRLPAGQIVEVGMEVEF